MRKRLQAASSEAKKMAEMPNVLTTKYTLNNGTSIPAVGFGTYRIKKRDVIMTAVDEALAAGYRLFDTASVYGNEHDLSEALKKLLPKYDLERDDIFITTKLSPLDHGGKTVIKDAYKKSLENLGLDYVDLYLIHFPGAAKLNSSDPKNKILRNETWASMAQLYDDGLVNAVGVSNFTVDHLKDLMKTNHGVIPTVNQVEYHPFYHQAELLNYCRENDIVVQAYCSLGGMSSNNDNLLENIVVKRIATKHNVTAAQVLLVWALQQDVAVIPKSTNPVHIKQNINLNFRISEDDMKALTKLGENNVKYAWDPTLVA